MRASARYKAFWISSVVIAVLAMAYLIVPPLINLNGFRNDFAAAITEAAGAPATINGNLRVSLLGRPMIAAKNVRVGDIEIDSIRFRINWGGLFDLRTAKISGAIKIDGLKMTAAKLSAPTFDRKIIITDSVVKYAGKDYEIVSGTLDAGRLSARVRTGEHKYNLDVENGGFTIKNPNEDLSIAGKLAADQNGNIAASGTFAIETADANQWFDFIYPSVRGRLKLTMNFQWDGKAGFDFTNIKGTAGKSSFDGAIKLGNGRKSVRMRIDNADLDLSFLQNDLGFLYNSDFNVAVAGNIRTPLPQFGTIKKLSLKMSSGADALDIAMMKAQTDKLSFSMSGRIAGQIAENLDVAMYQSTPEQSVRCLLSGTAENWKCAQWSAASKSMIATGTLNVEKDNFQMTFDSDNMKYDINTLDGLEQYIGSRSGIVEFRIANIAGTAKIGDGKKRIEFVQKGAMLSELPVELPLPAAMLATRGDLAADVKDKNISFVFKAPEWSLIIDDEDGFSINHRDARRFLGDLTGAAAPGFIKANIPVFVAGKYGRPIISDMRMSIGNMVMTGQLNGRSLMLSTENLDLDQIMDAGWFDNFADNQYLAGDPILAPFDFGADITLTADNIKMAGQDYAGFIYSLSPATQKFSITDSENGSMVASIAKDKSKYKYILQLNKFYVAGGAFGAMSPVNLRGSTITAEAELESFGITAYDIRRNMAGFVTAAFDGGVMSGIGTDNFYNNVNSMGRMDAENALAAALAGGETRVKEMQISGEYSGGDFRTTKPFFLAARHTDITGNLSIKNDAVSIRANLMLRGTAPVPKPIALRIDGKGRSYSLSEILPGLDLDYLREFVATHRKF
jgi:hypothetical protein